MSHITLFFSKKWVEHMKVEHNDTSPFKCEHQGCDFKTSQAAGLNNHSKIHRTYRKDFNFMVNNL